MNSMVQGFCRVFTPRLFLPSCNQVANVLNNGFQRSLYTIRPVGSDNLVAYNGVGTTKTSSSLLSVETLQYNQICGLKYLKNVHRRCKDCYLMYIEGVLHNFCTAHPRHKQKAKTKRPKNTWILTGVTTQTKLKRTRSTYL